MTTKRFSYKLDEIFDEGNHFAYALSKENAEDIVELLNELHEENQDLKSFNKDLAENLSACANARISKDNLIEKLTTENEQLKKELNAFKPIVFEDVNGGSSILYEKVKK